MALMICGVPRSGTTLMQRLCDAHPDLAVTYETRLFAFADLTVLGHARNISVNVTRRAVAGWRSGQGELFRTRVSFLMRYLAALAWLRPSPVDLAARETVLRHVFPHAAIVGDKYPGYVFDLDQYAGDPQVSCLVVYRDGRDVASSTLKAARTMWKGRHFIPNIDSPEKIASRWVFGIEKMLANRAQVYTVRYEELVEKPHAVMKGVGEWLGVDPTGFPTDDVRGSSIGKYREGLTDEELETVCEVAGATLAKLGYR